MRYCLLLILYVIVEDICAQTLIIRDAQDDTPLGLVMLSDSISGTVSMSREDGKVEISLFQNSYRITLSLLGYNTITLRYDQLSTRSEVYMRREGFRLDEVLVSATRWRQASMGTNPKVTSISLRDIAMIQPQTAADLLSITGKVFIQKSQQAGGSPMIRGFSANRLIYTVDGIRLNNAIFRGGNIQNVINIDPHNLERADVVFGPGSVNYGSDAIGGVMRFETLKPSLATGDDLLLRGKVSTRYSSANNERSGHWDINVGGKKWASLTSLSAWDFDHLRQGRHGPEEFVKPFFVEEGINEDKIINQTNPLLQIPTAYKQINLMQKIRYAPSQYWDILYALHHSSTGNYGRYDRHTRIRDDLPQFARWDYGPQSWTMNQLTLSNSKVNRVYDQMNLRLAVQSFGESRVSRRLNQDTQQRLVEKVNAYSVNWDFLKKLSDSNHFSYGIEYVLNKVNSSGKTIDITTGQSKPSPSRYPKADWYSAAVFANDNHKMTDKISIQTGLRYNLYGIDADFSPSLVNLPFERVKNQSGSFTGNLSVMFRPNHKTLINLTVSEAFRAPNVDDVGKFFDSAPGAVVVPNDNLTDERALNVEVGATTIIGERLKLESSAYFTRLNGALVRRNFMLDGRDSILYDGQLSQVQAIQNVAKAEVYGLHFGAELNLGQGFQFVGDINVQRGEEDDEGEVSPSRHTPPTFGRKRLEYRRDKWVALLMYQFQGGRAHEQMSIEERDKTEIYALDEQRRTYVAGWQTWDVKFLYKLSKAWHFVVGLENISDRRYRSYSSGVSAAGRNFVLSAQCQF